VWRAEAADARALFDLQRATRLLGHGGPVTTVAVDDTCIYSGSWDYSVRVWCRARLRQTALLSYDDWVWSVCPRLPHLLARAHAPPRLHTMHGCVCCGALWCCCVWRPRPLNRTCVS